MIRGEAAFHGFGFEGVSIINVENACASASTAFHVACNAIAAGAVDVALAVGAEKLTHDDKRRTMATFSCAVDLDAMPAMREQVERDLLGAPAGDGGDRPVQSALMDVYAETARRFFDRGGGSVEDAAAVAVKNRAHAALNPLAQFRDPLTDDQVMASRMIADPLRLLMCSPVADGAAGVVLCSAERARALGADDAPRVLASALRSGGVGDIDRNGVVRRAAAAAYEAAGVGPGDLDLVELHDAAAPAELFLYEQLGLCGAGGAPELLASGATRLGGRLPVNPSGGLLSRGHPIGATGLAQLVEVVDQLRGRCGERQVEGARVALAENGGGHIAGEEAVAVATILAVA
jgi:acetyl-CoA acetyltransferase